MSSLSSPKQLPASSPVARRSSTASPPPLPDVTPTVQSVSLQAILASPPPPPPSWPPHENGASTQTKRKHDSSDADDSQAKIRRIVRDYNTHDSRVMPMTTVVCLHAAVAQKSYGSEKRFLCPPPVVHIEGPLWQMRRQDLSMTVVSETGERSFEQKAPLDGNLTSSFKFLHVTGNRKGKELPALPRYCGPQTSRRSTASRVGQFRLCSRHNHFKPSKKTAKTRNISSCILAGGPVSLFNRINSQTVRTNNVAWSAFNVNVVPRPTDPPAITGPQPSGISTSPLIIRKVDKGRVSPEDGGPVSQMQKIALQRVNPDGSRHYLSAAGPMPGTTGVIPPPAPGSSSQAGSHPLLFQSPRLREEVKDGSRVIVDDVDDYLCWTIVGISKFQYTFFDAFGQNTTIPDMPITPFPTLFTAPVYRPNNNTMELTVANFFYVDPLPAPTPRWMSTWGILGHSVIAYIRQLLQAPPSSPPSPVVAARIGPVHAIVIVEMPALGDVVKTIEEDIEEGDSSGPSDGIHSSISGRSLPLLSFGRLMV
ncbi:hypothetical protein C8F01DRAFT_1244779 [Mycena amicta]|nr:hypothetical protein C8F01DRAFT_1244779 [Mycena amicta]